MDDHCQVDAAEDEKMRGELDKELHQKIAKIADNPMIYSVLAAADKLTESIISGIRDYIMHKNQSAAVVDEQHHRWWKQLLTEMWKRQRGVCRSIWSLWRNLCRKCFGKKNDN